jgi:DNA-binding NarL/FixJ family response regulator
VKGAGPDPEATRVLLVDDQELVRAGFRLILERAGFDVVGEASDGLEAVTLVGDLCPSVVLMDIRMPRMDGIEATRQIVRKDPEVRVLALTTFDLDEYVYAAVQAGAFGFLLKDVPPDDLVHAVRVVKRGESMLAPSLTRRLLERFVQAPRAGAVPDVWSPLTEQELRVAKCVARGLSNADIAAELFLSEATVKTYVSRLFTKLDVRDRVQVAVLAYETGLVQVGAG